MGILPPHPINQPPAGGARAKSAVVPGCASTFRLSCWWVRQAVTPKNLRGNWSPRSISPCPLCPTTLLQEVHAWLDPRPARLFTSSANREMSLFQGSLSPGAILGLDHYVDGLLLLFLGRLGFGTCAYLLFWTPGSLHNPFQQHQPHSGHHLSPPRLPLPAPPVVATHSKPPKLSS